MSLPASRAVVKIARFEKTLLVTVNGTGGGRGYSNSNAGFLYVNVW
jgi:hypothetical protein